jgi:DNA-binding NarL/FixJ family response regulator
MSSLRVLVADDHSLVRQGFQFLLQQLGYTVVGAASDGNEVIRLVLETRPDVVLMDISMPNLNGLEATRRLQKESPETKVIILSMHETPEYARQALRAGAAGYLVKDSDQSELKLAVEAVANGDVYLSPRISTHIVADLMDRAPNEADELATLTSRQREILQLLAEGWTRKGISEQLNISPKTYDTYRAQLMELLDIRDTAGLVRFAVSKGMVNSDE